MKCVERQGADVENTRSMKGDQGYEFKTNAISEGSEVLAWERHWTSLGLEDRAPRGQNEQLVRAGSARLPGHQDLGCEVGAPPGRLWALGTQQPTNSSSDQSIRHFMGRKFGSKMILIAAYVCFSFLSSRGRWGLLEPHLVFMPGACKNNVCGWYAWEVRTQRSLETLKSLAMLALGAGGGGPRGPVRWMNFA